MKKIEKKYLLLIILYLAFISLGLPDGITGVAWPNIRADLNLPLSLLGIITSTIYICSAISSFSSGSILKRFSTSKVTFISCILTASALLGFSISKNFYWLIIMSIPLGLGAGSVDTGLNNFVANHYSAKHMNWLHCFWGLGASLGTTIMTIAISTSNWRNGYVYVSMVQFTLAIIILISIFIKLWDIPHSDNNDEDVASVNKIKLFQKRDQLASMLIFLFYTGIEFSMSAWIASVLIDGYDVSAKQAGLVASSFYFAIMVGRFVTGIIIHKIGNNKIIILGMLTGVIGILLLFFVDAYAFKLIGTIILGLGLAPIFPSLVHETPRRFTKEVSQKLIGFQMGSASIGVVILTISLGVILDNISLYLFFPLLLFFLIIIILLNLYLESKLKIVNR